MSNLTKNRKTTNISETMDIPSKCSKLHLDKVLMFIGLNGAGYLTCSVKVQKLQASFFPSHPSPLSPPPPTPTPLPQVPALFRLPIFDECSTGVGYALLLTVPVFYVCSSLLFSLLGCVIFYWEKRQAKKLSSYNVFTNENAQTSVIPQ